MLSIIRHDDHKLGVKMKMETKKKEKKRRTAAALDYQGEEQQVGWI